jgi:hypothetical protein
LIVFIIVIIIPSENSTNPDKNKEVNYFIVARYFFFVLAIIGCCMGFVPLVKLWNYKLIPDRVESKSQKDKISKLVEEEKLLKSMPKPSQTEIIEKPVININHENKLLRNLQEENNLENNENKEDLKMKFSGLRRKVANS